MAKTTVSTVFGKLTLPYLHYDQRLLAEQQTQVPNSMPNALQAFGISSGFKRSFGKLFMSHPPLQERIQALQTQRS